MEGSARIIIQEGGAPPPDPRILPLAPVRHAGDCHVDGGVILRGGGRPLKQAREASDTGAIQRDLLRPFSSTAIPASLQGFLLQVLRPAWGRRAFFYNFFLGEGDGSAPALSVGSAPDFFSEVNYSVMDLEVSSGQVEDTDVIRVSLSRFRLIGLSLFWASTLL